MITHRGWGCGPVAYCEQDERMLGQYVNQASDFSDIAFTMPALTLTGSATNS